MPDEALITQIENLLAEVVELGGQNERSAIVPNLTVQDANPTNLTGFVIVSDDRDGDNILAKKVGSVIYTNNDLVNVMFLKGGEAIAFQQGSQSTNNGIWEIVPSTTTDIFYDKGDVAIGKAVAPDAALEILDTAQAQLRLTFEEDVKFTTFTVDTSHHITIDPSSTGLIKLAADVTVTNLISHEGDLDTELAFTDDQLSITIGGLLMIEAIEIAGQDTLDLGDVGGGGDVDIDFNDGQMFLQGSDGKVGIKTSTPEAFLQVGSGTPVIDPGANNVIMAGPDTFSGRFYIEGTGQADFLLVDGGAGVDLKASQLVNISGVTRFRSLTDAGGNNVDNIISMTHTNGRVGMGVLSALAQLHIDQASTTAAIPTLYLDQADISEEMIEFNTTIGVGNAIEAVGAKTLTVTHFIKVTLPGALTRYIEVGTIA